jgi:hypothetical protein
MAQMLACGHLIADFLQQQLASGPGALFKKVLELGELKDIEEERQIVPALYVVPGELAKSGGSRVEGYSEWVETWQVVIAVNTAALVRQSRAKHMLLVPLVDKLFDTLEGWTPGEGYAALEALTPAAMDYEGRFVLYPTMWATGFTRCGG